MHTSYVKNSSLVLLLAALSGCFCKEVPPPQKLIDFSNNGGLFTLDWPSGRGFQLVLGLPLSDTNAGGFQGELVFRQGRNVITKVPVDSNNLMACNWLDQPNRKERLNGYILTWGRSTRERLDQFCRAGESYDVEVHFAQAPSPASSLWLHWLSR